MCRTGSFTQKFGSQIALSSASSNGPDFWPEETQVSGLAVVNSKICDSLRADKSLENVTQEKLQPDSATQQTTEHSSNDSVTKSEVHLMR